MYSSKCLHVRIFILLLFFLGLVTEEVLPVNSEGITPNSKKKLSCRYAIFSTIGLVDPYYKSLINILWKMNDKSKCDEIREDIVSGWSGSNNVLGQVSDWKPDYVAAVMAPEEEGRIFFDTFFRISRNADVDPFVDFSWGIITGMSGEIAKKWIVKQMNVEKFPDLKKILAIITKPNTESEGFENFILWQKSFEDSVSQSGFIAKFLNVSILPNYTEPFKPLPDPAYDLTQGVSLVYSAVPCHPQLGLGDGKRNQVLQYFNWSWEVLSPFVFITPSCDLAGLGESQKVGVIIPDGAVIPREKSFALSILKNGGIAFIAPVYMDSDIEKVYYVQFASDVFYALTALSMTTGDAMQYAYNRRLAGCLATYGDSILGDKCKVPPFILIGEPTFNPHFNSQNPFLTLSSKSKDDQFNIYVRFDKDIYQPKSSVDESFNHFPDWMYAFVETDGKIYLALDIMGIRRAGEIRKITLNTNSGVEAMEFKYFLEERKHEIHRVHLFLTIQPKNNILIPKGSTLELTLDGSKLYSASLPASIF